MRTFRPSAAASGLLLVLVVSGCAGGSGSTTTATSVGASGSAPGTAASASPARSPTTIEVPGDHATIQAAVDASVPGDLILVAPGVYRETVVIETPRIVLRGLDRSGVVIDGEGRRENGVKVFADGVAVENLTVQNHAANGVLVSGDSYEGGAQLNGFRVSYVTALANELYGVYSFAAEGGVIDHVYASGSGDAGVYVGRCDPCRTLVTEVLAEHNAIGFEGTNASADLWVVSSVWRANRVGITVNSQKLERKAPQHDAVIAGNLVDGEGAALSPAQASGAFGLGIAIGGGRDDLVVRNRVVNNLAVGIAVTDLDDYLPTGVRVEGNELAGNATDIAAYRTKVAELAAGALCLHGNEAAIVSPPDLATTVTCDAPTGAGTAIDSAPPALPRAPSGVSADRLPPAPMLPSLPDASGAPARPVAAPVAPDLAAISAPAS